MMLIISNIRDDLQFVLLRHVSLDILGWSILKLSLMAASDLPEPKYSKNLSKTNSSKIEQMAG